MTHWPLNHARSSVMPIYTLDNAAERGFPDTFQIPPQVERESLGPGDFVKLIFGIEFDDG